MSDPQAEPGVAPCPANHTLLEMGVVFMHSSSMTHCLTSLTQIFEYVNTLALEPTDREMFSSACVKGNAQNKKKTFSKIEPVKSDSEVGSDQGRRTGSP
jgi:hypothetical protein